MDAQIGFLLPALRDDRLRAYARVMQEEAEAYFERWGDRGEADLLVAMNELTVFIASRCLVGGDFRRAVTEEFARLYHDLEGSVNLLTFLQPRAAAARPRAGGTGARARMTALISRVVAERRARGAEAEDFLESLMCARYPDGRTLGDGRDHRASCWRPCSRGSTRAPSSRRGPACSSSSTRRTSRPSATSRTPCSAPAAR